MWSRICLTQWRMYYYSVVKLIINSKWGRVVRDLLSFIVKHVDESTKRTVETGLKLKERGCKRRGNVLGGGVKGMRVTRQFSVLWHYTLVTEILRFFPLERDLKLVSLSKYSIYVVFWNPSQRGGDGFRSHNALYLFCFFV